MTRRRQLPDSRLLVHCADGCEQSGFFCALLIILEQIINEQTLDVFQAVRMVRQCRPQFVTSLDQYRWLHEAALEYISSYSDYANFQRSIRYS